MANKFISFKYDPTEEGYSSSMWRTLYGDAYVSNNSLVLEKSEIIHYGDILRGDVSFTVTIEKPKIDDNIRIGLIQYSLGAYMYFKIDQGGLSIETSDGIDSNSISLDWQDEWSGVPVEFRIKWETGLITFYIGGQWKAYVSDSTIPTKPLSLYAFNDSVSEFAINYIIAKSIQSYVVSTGNDNSEFEAIITESDKLNITEDITSVASIPNKSLTDDTSIIENVSVEIQP